MQPNVAMFMEPAANDWHLVELVVKNFGQTPAYGIRFDWAHPPTVGKYETAYEDRYVDIVPLNLPAEIPYLAPSQEWRIVWDSALDRRELGETIASRFDGAVTYSNQPKDAKVSKRSRKQFKSTAVLDWATLHPVERLELLTTHDLARQEKQKLELLRNLLTYYHYAASESREEVLRSEINRVRNAADGMRERLTEAEFSAPESPHPSPTHPAPRVQRTHGGPRRAARDRKQAVAARRPVRRAAGEPARPSPTRTTAAPVWTTTTTTRHPGDQRTAPAPALLDRPALLPDRADADLPQAELGHTVVGSLAALRDAAIGIQVFGGAVSFRAHDGPFVGESGNPSLPG